MTSSAVTLDAARAIVVDVRAAIAPVLARATEVTQQGRAIDDHQVLTQRIASLATQVTAAEVLVADAGRLRDAGNADVMQERMALAYAARTMRAFLGEVDAGLDGADGAPAVEALREPARIAAMRAGADEAVVREIGRALIDMGGANNLELLDETATLTRSIAREFAKHEVAPVAQAIHREDLLIPEALLERFSAQGFFGSSIPEGYGGSGMGELPMVIITEELSAASLGAAGSLATRPEILAKALLEGGTEEQRATWLPRIASGEALVAVAVTEPDVGSDVASVQTRARPAERDGESGWLVSGTKAWSTFAGRANLLAVLVRTDPDTALGGRGLSLFMIEKPPYDGHRWRYEQPGGGVIEGTANPTPGYRGMHSFTLAFDDVWVPDTHLVGGEAGRGRGFYMQMGGFAAGRLQTAGRACGLAQAALEKACTYVAQRRQFGQAIADFQLTQYQVGLMAVQLAAARQLTYVAARAFDTRSMLPSMAKLLACDVAGEVTRAAQVLHGGWGYSEEDPISRYVLDALVLPIFEGAKAVLELRVIGRALLSGDA